MYKKRKKKIHATPINSIQFGRIAYKTIEHIFNIGSNFINNSTYIPQVN
jgi:hypothetical protein